MYRGVYRVGHGGAEFRGQIHGCCLGWWEGCASRGLRGRVPARAGQEAGLPSPPWSRRAKTEIKGLKTRRSSHKDKTVWRGIPVTSVARTLVDIAADLSEEDLARACHEAGVRHHTTPGQVKAILARRPNTPGARKLWAVMSR